MSEIAASEKENGESSGTIVESSTGDVAQNRAEDGRTLESQTDEDKATLESDSVDVTVESNDCESISLSSSTTEYESCKSQLSDGTNEEVNDSSIDKDSDEDSDEEEDEDHNGEGTVTCALLGLEQAKVSFINHVLSFRIFPNQRPILCFDCDFESEIRDGCKSLKAKTKQKIRTQMKQIAMQFHEISCTFHWMSDFNFYGRKLPNSVQILKWTMAFLKQPRGNSVNFYFFMKYSSIHLLYSIRKIASRA